MSKIRLDNLLVKLGFADTRSKAQGLIVAGRVCIGNVKCEKAGHQVATNAQITVTGHGQPYFSRGAVKLAHAVAHFKLSPAGATCIDIGASTGGFTEVLLQGGARKVYAVDVGHGQLDRKLQEDERVVVLEKMNARYLTPGHIPEAIGWVVCDASFISLKTVLPAALSLTAQRATLVALIKPQFEVGKGRIGKGGIVRDAVLHAEICDDIQRWISGLGSWQVIGVTPSPVRSPKGNAEFLICAQKTL